MPQAEVRSTQVQPEERAATVLSFVLFFCVMAGYFAVRPVRETVGTLLGADVVANIYWLTWIGSLLLVPLYGALLARSPRRVLLPWLYGAVALLLAIVALLLGNDAVALVPGVAFYVLISVLNLFIVSVFWSFLLELCSVVQSTRLFGVIAAGGSLGALCGPLLTDLIVVHVGNEGILLLGSAWFVSALVIQRLLLRTGFGALDAGSALALERPIGGNPFAGFGLVLGSPYLLAVAGFVVLASTVNTFLYFEQLHLATEHFADPEARTRFFARVDWVVQALTLLCQLFATGRIATRLGVTALLVLVPMVMVGGFAALALGGGLTALVVVMVLRRSGEYALVRIGRELVFAPLDAQTKYKAKNVIDVPVYRGADAVAAQAQGAIRGSGLGAEGLMWIGAGVATAWCVLAFKLGRTADARARQAVRVG